MFSIYIYPVDAILGFTGSDEPSPEFRTHWELVTNDIGIKTIVLSCYTEGCRSAVGSGLGHRRDRCPLPQFFLFLLEPH